MSDTRLNGLDTARGAAMFLVCLSHFLLGVSDATGEVFDPKLLVMVTAVASPTFMVVSGVVFGYLVTRAGNDPWRIRARLVDRALVLLVPVHMLVRLPHMLGDEGLAAAVTVIEITDTIAIAILLNLWLVNVPAVRRLGIALMIFTLSWTIKPLWQPDDTLEIVVKDVLMRATWDDRSLIHGFAVLPWMAVHLAATVVGERIARSGRAFAWPALARGMVRFGTAGIAMAVAVKLAELAWRHAAEIDRSSRTAVTVSNLVSPFGKYPPSPGYLAFCGGAGLLFLAVVFTWEQSGWVSRIRSQLTLLGRSSLCVWVVQSWLYWGLVERLPVPAVPWLPLYFAVTMGMILWIATAWDRNGCNRWLTLGVAALVRRITDSLAAGDRSHSTESHARS